MYPLHHNILVGLIEKYYDIPTDTYGYLSALSTLCTYVHHNIIYVATLEAPTAPARCWAVSPGPEYCQLLVQHR